MKKNVLRVIAVIVLIIGAYFGITKIQSILKQNALNEQIYSEALVWKNPTAPQEETWKNGIVNTKDGGLWDLAAVDGGGQVKPAPWHVGNILITNITNVGNVLSLEVTHDSEFDNESGKLVSADLTMAKRYNNAFLIGMSGWMPIPSQGQNKGKRIVLEYVARWPLGDKSYGSSGIWFEKVGTFDSRGKMVKDFQSAGLSWLGKNSVMMRGFNIEGVTRAMPNGIKQVTINDMEKWNTYKTTIEWKGKDKWLFTFSQNNGKQEEIEVTPIGPMEVQIWKDNYKITYALFNPYTLNYENIPEGVVDQFQVKYMKIYEEEIK